MRNLFLGLVVLGFFPTLGSAQSIEYPKVEVQLDRGPKDRIISASVIFNIEGDARRTESRKVYTKLTAYKGPEVKNPSNLIDFHNWLLQVGESRSTDVSESLRDFIVNQLISTPINDHRLMVFEKISEDNLSFKDKTKRDRINGILTVAVPYYILGDGGRYDVAEGTIFYDSGVPGQCKPYKLELKLGSMTEELKIDCNGSIVPKE